MCHFSTTKNQIKNDKTNADFIAICITFSFQFGEVSPPAPSGGYSGQGALLTPPPEKTLSGSKKGSFFSYTDPGNATVVPPPTSPPEQSPGGKRISTYTNPGNVPVIGPDGPLPPQSQRTSQTQPPQGVSSIQPYRRVSLRCLPFYVYAILKLDKELLREAQNWLTILGFPFYVSQRSFSLDPSVAKTGNHQPVRRGVIPVVTPPKSLPNSKPALNDTQLSVTSGGPAGNLGTETGPLGYSAPPVSLAPSTGPPTNPASPSALPPISTAQTPVATGGSPQGVSHQCHLKPMKERPKTDDDHMHICRFVDRTIQKLMLVCKLNYTLQI